MKVAIWLLSALLLLPFAEIVVFVLVAVWVGLGWAALAVLATSLTGALMLRHGGGSHVARMRVVLGPQRVSALETDGPGTMFVVAAILLLIPGFITDAVGLLMLVRPLRRALGALLLRLLQRHTKPSDTPDVVDLTPQEWRQVPDAQLRDERRRDP